MNPSDGKKWVDVIFPHPPLQRFTYEVPDRFHQELLLGHRVLVPLGSRRLTGFVVDFVPHPEIENLREIEDIVDAYPLLTPELLKLTRWVAEYYISTWGEVIRAALPPGIHRKSNLSIRRIETAPLPQEPLSESSKTILSIVQDKGKISLRGLEKQMGTRRIRFELAKLEKRGLVQVEHVLEKPRVHAQLEKWVSLCEGLDPEDIYEIRKRAPKQAEVLAILTKHGGEARRSNLGVDFPVLRRLEKNGWIEIWEEEVFREPYQEYAVEPPKPVTLTEEQTKALSHMDGALKKEKFRVFLLHGVTASGKTQVYIESIRQILDRGKTALVLIPEISLTPQAVQRYRGTFGDEVAVLHSRMSPGERYDSWRKVREGKCRIALGPRSTVFAPLENLGLIIVDEEHESSYKQMDPAPRYHARDVAVLRGKLNDCAVILGSATPSLESYFNSLEGKYILCELTHRVDRIPMSKVTLVSKRPPAERVALDYGQRPWFNVGPATAGPTSLGSRTTSRASNFKINQGETKANDESRVLSPLLREKIEERLKKGEQVILLQNRRGYATFLRCGACGTIEECPHCDITLTYHQKDHRLHCHYCGFQKPAPEVCPSCQGATLHYRGVGTQRVEAEIQKLFPKAQLLRMDQDTTRRKGAHDRIVLEFEKGKGEVLLGTQMVAKGHDFPHVGLVGIISADTGLYFPDFRSAERTFQLLTQAAGRAGRKHVRGEVIIQTLSPENPALQFAVEQDYLGFYRWEIDQRKELGYPPWGKIVAVRFKGARKERVAKAAHLFAEQVPPDHLFELLGPASSPLSRIKRMYRYQIIFRQKRDLDPSGRKLRGKVRRALTRFHEKTHFPDVRVGVDVDPADMM